MSELSGDFEILVTNPSTGKSDKATINELVIGGMPRRTDYHIKPDDIIFSPTPSTEIPTAFGPIKISSTPDVYFGLPDGTIEYQTPVNVPAIYLEPLGVYDYQEVSSITINVESLPLRYFKTNGNVFTILVRTSVTHMQLARFKIFTSSRV